MIPRNLSQQRLGFEVAGSLGHGHPSGSLEKCSECGLFSDTIIVKGRHQVLGTFFWLKKTHVLGFYLFYFFRRNIKVQRKTHFIFLLFFLDWGPLVIHEPEIIKGEQPGMVDHLLRFPVDVWSRGPQGRRSCVKSPSQVVSCEPTWKTCNVTTSNASERNGNDDINHLQWYVLHSFRNRIFFSLTIRGLVPGDNNISIRPSPAGSGEERRRPDAER